MPPLPAPELKINTHRHCQLFLFFFLWLIYSQESREMTLLLPKRVCAPPPQPKPCIQAGRYRAVTNSFLELLKLHATLICAVPLVRSLTPRGKWGQTCLWLSQVELWGCNYCYNLWGQNTFSYIPLVCWYRLFSWVQGRVRTSSQVAQCPKITSLSYFPWKYPEWVWVCVFECVWERERVRERVWACLSVRIKVCMWSFNLCSYASLSLFEWICMCSLDCTMGNGVTCTLGNCYPTLAVFNW